MAYVVHEGAQISQLISRWLKTIQSDSMDRDMRRIRLHHRLARS